MQNLLLNIDWRFSGYEFMGEKLSRYLAFAAIVIVTLLLKHPVAMLLARAGSRMAAKFSYLRHRNAVRDMLFKPMERLLQVVLYFLATEQISGLLDKVTFPHAMLSEKRTPISLGEVTDHIFLFLFILYLTQLVSHFLDFIYYLRMGKEQLEKDASRMQLLPLFKEVSKLALWVISLFWMLGSVFHVNVPALITGLGIGGVAIALAGKQTVENFFAAFTLLSDKPFVTGDMIKIGDVEGVVERIGFRSTRLRSAEGAAYVIPNQNLVSQNLINLSARDTRGMKVVANIRYGITHESLTQLIARIKETLSQTPPLKAPIDVYIEAFDLYTFQLVVAYYLPHPLPEETNLTDLKRDVNLKVFGLLSASTTMGAPVA